MVKDLTFGVLERVGSTPREQLAWAVGLVEGRGPETPEDWENLRRDLFVGFAMYAAGAPSYGLATHDDDARKLLTAFREILPEALKHKSIAVALQPRALVWSKGRYVETVDPLQDDFRRAVLRGLARRIRECGHLLKRCEAPAKLRPGRKISGAPKPGPSLCGKLFVARKQTQRYCSGPCASRTVTRKKRSRPKRQPAMKKRPRRPTRLA